MGGSIPMFWLTRHGDSGLFCDERGVGLGPVTLVEKAKTNGLYVYRVRPAEEVAHALALAYGPLTADDLARRLSGLDVAARALDAGEMAKAMIATVLLKLPPLSPKAMAKLARDPSLKKYNRYHRPAHSPDGTGGQFTDADGATGGGLKPIMVADRSGGASPKRLSPSAVAAGIESTPPVYKQDFVKQPEWISFNNAVAAVPGITATEQFVYSENFAAEGGTTPDDDVPSGHDPTVSGITDDTLRAAKKAGVPGLKGVRKPEDLNDKQRAAVYQYYYDHVLGRVGGKAALDAIGDKYTAAAVGDTLFRHGESGGADLVRGVLKDIYHSIPEDQRDQLGLDAGFEKEKETGRLGPRTLDTLQKLVRGGFAQKFRDTLADKREEKNHETERNDNFRFKGK
jgi:hypothetical protein